MVTGTGQAKRSSCPQCDARVSGTAVLCPNCGETLSPSTRAARRRPATEESPIQQVGELLGTVGFLLAGGSVVLFLVSSFTPSMVSVVLGCLSLILVGAALGMSRAALGHQSAEPLSVKWHAIAGLVLGIFAAVLWVVYVVALVLLPTGDSVVGPVPFLVTGLISVPLAVGVHRWAERSGAAAAKRRGLARSGG